MSSLEVAKVDSKSSPICFGNWDQAWSRWDESTFLNALKWKKQSRELYGKSRSSLLKSFRKHVSLKTAPQEKLISTLLWTEGMIAGSEPGPFLQIIIDWASSVQTHQQRQHKPSRGFMGQGARHAERVMEALQQPDPLISLQPQEMLAALLLLVVLAEELPDETLWSLWRICLLGS